MGGKSSTPKADPAVGRAAEANAEIGREALQLSREQYADQKSLNDQFQPIYEQLLKAALDEQGDNAGRADSQWGQYESVFQPIENRMADEAMTYDSPAEVARREGLAAATVGRQFDASTAEMGRQMGRMGVAPTSSLGLQAMTDQGNAKALATAGAVNKERSDTKLLGMSMRQEAARFGRNQTGTGLAASAAALQGGNSAQGAMAGQTNQAAAAGQAAQGLMGTAVGANNSSGGLALNQWQAKANAAGTATAGLGSLLGTGMMAGAMAFSSEKLKEDGTPADDQAALDGLMKVPVEDWKYKDGVADGGRHTGPYAEDMNEQFGDDVAPGGLGLDMVSVSGKHHAAIRALGKDLAKIKGQLGLSPIPVPDRDRRDTEPKEERSSRLPQHLQADMAAGLVGLQRI